MSARLEQVCRLVSCVVIDCCVVGGRHFVVQGLIKRLKELGAEFEREGSNHEIWRKGKITESVPRHREINEILARKIIKKFEQSGE